MKEARFPEVGNSQRISTDQGRSGQIAFHRVNTFNAAYATSNVNSALIQLGAIFSLPSGRNAS
jgi:hypothetical protein